jgi:hypothetical protein
LEAFFFEAQAAMEYPEVGDQEQGQLYDPELDSAFLEGSATGDTLQWYREQGDQALGEGTDLKALRHLPTTYVAAEGGLEKDSDSDIVGYATDDEDSPLIGKKFGT